VREPAGLLVDRHHNLWVAAGETLRVLPAQDGAPPRGDGPVRTALGRPPRATSPERELSCLRGVTGLVDSEDVVVVDACLGAAVRVAAVAR
jgi:hypothetical protein